MATVINIHRRGLAAVQLFAARNDIRYFLNGVKVEATKDATRLIATNGHVLAIHHSNEPNTVAEPAQCIVPIEVLRHIGKASRGSAGLPIELTRMDEPAQWQLRDYASGFCLVFKEIEGKFPDYMNIIPKEADGAPATYNPDYLSLVKRAGQALGVKKYPLVVAQNGGKGGLASSSAFPEFFAVVMPLRDTSERKAPAWLGEPFMTPAISAMEAA